MLLSYLQGRFYLPVNGRRVSRSALVFLGYRPQRVSSHGEVMWSQPELLNTDRGNKPPCLQKYSANIVYTGAEI